MTDGLFAVVSCCSEISFRDYSQSRDRTTAVSNDIVRVNPHHGDHPQSTDSASFTAKRLMTNSSPPVGADWPVSIINTPPDNSQQRQHQQSCTYQSATQNHFEHGVVGMATRYDDIGTACLADRFLSSSYNTSEHLQSPLAGHHGFVSPTPAVQSGGAGQLFYGEHGGLDVGGLTPECSPDRPGGGIDVGGLRGTAFPSMTVNLSMSMNVVEAPTRRLPQTTQQTWNVMGGLMNDADLEDDDDDDVVCGVVPDMRWPTAYTMHQSNPHQMNQQQQQQQQTAYRIGESSYRPGWRLNQLETAPIEYFKRSPTAILDCSHVSMTSDQSHNSAYSMTSPSSELNVDAREQHMSGSRYRPVVAQQTVQSGFYAGGCIIQHQTTPISSKYQQRRDVTQHHSVTRQVSARCQHRLFTGVHPISTSSSLQARHHHHHHQVAHHHQHQQQQHPTHSRLVAAGRVKTSSQTSDGVTCPLASSSMTPRSVDGSGGRVFASSGCDQQLLGGRPNVCRICDKTYARPSTLKTHLRTHSGEKPYSCSTCRKAFSQAANLTAHLRTHTGERPFSCPICTRRFSQSSSVATHLRTHSGERPYRCRLCSKTFSDSSTLTKHLRIHSGEKPYQCSICLLRFSQSGNLNRHKRVHGPVK